ncbi:MAG: response regulator [Bacteroidota bacterium]|jgi:CheY-like chemotaxis protein/predicted hydrocarbon binding protein|nr:response regulator [Bacteroidota bacterium]
MEEGKKIKLLEERIAELERENNLLKRNFSSLENGSTVSVPKDIQPLFDNAQKIVGEYFRDLKMDPSHGTIEINDERYVLVRASALSYDFLTTIKELYSDRGEKEAMSIGKNFLFDVSHVIGINDAKNFHSKMNLKEPIEKLSAGPVHFAYSGWAYVDILPESNPSPDENYYMVYRHPFSFEADSWIRSGKRSDTAVCIMNAGYSSGWCEESFGFALTSVEVTCKAKGDEHCTFIMSPPHKIQQHISKYTASPRSPISEKSHYDIPTFFERKKVEEEMQTAKAKAEESDKAKSLFLANMSHEIRTPMNAIIGYVELILNDRLSAEHRDYLENVKESGKLLLHLINDILDISKIEAGQLVVESEPVSIKTLFDGKESVFKHIIEKNDMNVKFIRTLPENIAREIYSDRTRLQQIIYNLLSNAVKFTSEGTIELGVSLKDPTTLEFYVKDSGIGLEKKDHGRVFEMFGQADASITRTHGGSGLGLTIAKKLVQLLGGTIRVESAKGKGAAFYFTVPYKPVPIAESISVDANSSIETKDVLLLVEDNLVNQRLTKLILEKAGYNVITANNGEIAVEKYKSHRDIKLILMDVQMPVLDGLLATEAIREHESAAGLSRTPVIALTAHAMKGDKERCLEAGCDNYLSKPIMMEVLIGTIRKYI